MSNVVDKVKKKASLGFSDLKYFLGSKITVDNISSFQRILLYHGIDKTGNTKINSRFISNEAFEEQLIFFKEHFHVVSIEDYYSAKFHSKKPTLCLTFDDGYANNYHYVFPLLEKYQIPATILITTLRAAGNDILWADVLDIAAYKYKKPFEIEGERFSLKRKTGYVSEATKIPLKESIKQKGYDYKLKMQKAIPDLNKILRSEELKGYWELLSPAEIKEMAASNLITIGSHGYYHNCLETLSATELTFELRESKKWLEEIIKKPVMALAFPDGSFSQEVIDTAKQMGYHYLLTVDGKMNGINENSELRSRMGMNPHISFNNQLAAIIKGSY